MRTLSVNIKGGARIHLRQAVVTIEHVAGANIILGIYYFEFLV